mmetsp:Transcript_16386/g.42273  ORF Transcript_16386/g.42273 Transcript_16386/m.42273 type:complete len:303 (+) Transcript_16386:172-1080(+)
MDFIKEAKNCERTRKAFAGNVDVVVPAVRWGLTTSRVFVMEFIENAVPMTRRDFYLDNPGVSRKRVAKTLVEVFAQMSFVDGFVHCDPHAGNILIRRKPGGREGDFELAILDHGLYRELGDPFVRTYCNMWKSVIFQDFAGLRRAAEELGVPGMEHFIGMVVFNRPVSAGGVGMMGLSSRARPEDVKKFVESFRDGTVELTEVLSFLEVVPRDLLLVSKTNNLIRSAMRSMETDVNRFVVSGRAAIDGSYHVEMRFAAREGWMKRCRIRLQYAYDLLRFWAEAYVLLPLVSLFVPDHPMAHM